MQIIYKSIEYVKKFNQFFILIIITDSKPSDECELETMKAIEYASNFALSIVMIGVGDGPWDSIFKYDFKLINRKFDNFQFVNFNRFIPHPSKTNLTNELKFILKALTKVPEQYKIIKNLGYIPF